MTDYEKIIISENTQPNFSTNLAKHTITMDLDHYNCLEEYIRRILDELEQKDEEIQELKKQINGAFDRGFIHKDKIKEKIEKLNELEKQQLKGTKRQDRYYIKQKYIYKRSSLQELLEREE